MPPRGRLLEPHRRRRVGGSGLSRVGPRRGNPSWATACEMVLSASLRGGYITRSSALQRQSVGGRTPETAGPTDGQRRKQLVHVDSQSARDRLGLAPREARSVTPTITFVGARPDWLGPVTDGRGKRSRGDAGVEGPHEPRGKDLDRGASLGAARARQVPRAELTRPPCMEVRTTTYGGPGAWSQTDLRDVRGASHRCLSVHGRFVSDRTSATARGGRSAFAKDSPRHPPEPRSRSRQT